jgi:hypothetical protein
MCWFLEMIDGMAILDDRIDDFISRWQEVFGESITRDQAQVVAIKVLTFYRLITGPLPAASEDIGEIRDVGDVGAPMPPLGLNQEKRRNSPIP